jgi:hypothetical protein
MLHLKLSVIDGVEAHESAKEPPVRFDNAIAEKVSWVVRRFSNSSSA